MTFVNKVGAISFGVTALLAVIGSAAAVAYDLHESGGRRVVSDQQQLVGGIVRIRDVELNNVCYVGSNAISCLPIKEH